MEGLQSESGEQVVVVVPQTAQSVADIQSLGYEELLTEKGRLLGLISSKEIELRQLEQSTPHPPPPPSPPPPPRPPPPSPSPFTSFFLYVIAVERRLIDSQGDAEENGNQVKDLTEILGDFPSTVLRHTQALLTLDDITGNRAVHRSSMLGVPVPPAGLPEVEVPLPEPDLGGDRQDQGSEEQRARLNVRDSIGLDFLFSQFDTLTFNTMICGEVVNSFP